MRSVAPESTEWRNTEELLATLIEVIDYGNRLFIMANSKKGARHPKPIKVIRPYQPEPERPRRRQATGEEMRAFFSSGV